MLGDKVLEVDRHKVTKDDWVRNFHHGRLKVNREQNARFHAVNLGLDEVTQGGNRHIGCVNDGAFFVGQAVFENGFGAVCSGKDDLCAASLRCGDGRRLFVGAEIIARHRGDGGFAVSGPVAHAVWVRLGVFFDRFGRTTVRVAFAQDRVHSRTLDRVIAGADVFFFVGRWVCRIIRDVIPLALQLRDGRVQLRHRGRNVRQLDDVCIRCFHQTAQFGQIVIDTLFFGQTLGEGRQDTASDRNVAGFDADVSGASKRADDRQQRCAGKLGRFVDNGVNDVGCVLGHLDSPIGSATRTQADSAYANSSRSA